MSSGANGPMAGGARICGVGGCVVRGWLARMPRAARVTVCWMRRCLVEGLFALAIHSRISCLEDGGKRAKFARAA